MEGMVLDFDGEVTEEASAAAAAEEEEEAEMLQEDSSCACTRFVIAYSLQLQPVAAVGVHACARIMLVDTWAHTYVKCFGRPQS